MKLVSFLLNIVFEVTPDNLTNQLLTISSLKIVSLPELLTNMKEISLYTSAMGVFDNQMTTQVEEYTKPRNKSNTSVLSYLQITSKKWRNFSPFQQHKI